MVSYENLLKRITTRVLAKRILKQRDEDRSTMEREKSLSKQSARSRSSSQYTYSNSRTSKFLLGTAIPNSTIKSNLQNGNNRNMEDRNSLRAKRDASVKEILARLESRLGFIPSYLQQEDKTSDTAVTVLQNPYKQENSTLNLSIAEKTSTRINVRDTQKQKQRVSRRTAVLAPLDGERRSNYESIKQAIHSSEQRRELINADKMENERLKKGQQFQGTYRNSVLMELQNATTKMTSKSSRTSRNSFHQSESSKKLKTQNKRKKSILKRGSTSNTKQLRSVSIIESKMDSETQTYLKMRDFN